MLNLDAIAHTRMQSVPYSYAVIENLLPKAASLELAASFPQEQFRLSTGEGYGYLWSDMLASNEDIALMYKFCDACGGRSHRASPELSDRWRDRIAQGRLSSNLGNLSSIWRQMIEELWTPSYRQALTQMSGVELKDCAMVIGFRRYNLGHCHRPHTDEPSKALTHLLFFNEQWPMDWGGCLRILLDEKPESVFQDIAPLNQFSAVIVRSDNSWHMVTPVASTALQCRLALRITFFHNLDAGA
ncbi:2OG-Fe(II) oxygenase family protein [Nostoc sp.]|uniref:2OG-Fe(II) oxygenase family protein n=1 Tax=Nostoc sp. TaxID=1180 RepID=UPI002FF57A0C